MTDFTTPKRSYKHHWGHYPQVEAIPLHHRPCTGPLCEGSKKVSQKCSQGAKELSKTVGNALHLHGFPCMITPEVFITEEKAR